MIKTIKSEISQVKWPSRKKTVTNTFIIAGVTAASAIVIGTFDLAFTYIAGLFR